jgi:hypothetical protein
MEETHLTMMLSCLRGIEVINIKEKELKPMKTWDYKLVTPAMWASFDYGTVEARTIEFARAQALTELQNNFQKVNEVLASADVTKGMTIEFEKSCIEVTEQPAMKTPPPKDLTVNGFIRNGFEVVVLDEAGDWVMQGNFDTAEDGVKWAEKQDFERTWDVRPVK